jgi:uncharacterized coiled-coil protein SlyX
MATYNLVFKLNSDIKIVADDSILYSKLEEVGNAFSEIMEISVRDLENQINNNANPRDYLIGIIEEVAGSNFLNNFTYSLNNEEIALIEVIDYFVNLSTENQNSIDELSQNMVEIQEQVGINTDSINSLNTALSNITDSLNSAKDRITAIETSTVIQDQIDQINTALVSLESSVDSNSQNISDVDSQINLLSNRITALENTSADNSELQSLKDRVLALETSSSTQDQIDVIISDIETLENQVTQNSDSISLNSANLSLLQNRITTLENTVSDVTEIEEIKSRLDELELLNSLTPQVADLISRVGDLELDKISKDLQISEIDSSITAINSSMSSIQESLSTLSDEVVDDFETVNNAVANINTSIDNINTSLNLLTPLNEILINNQTLKQLNDKYFQEANNGFIAESIDSSGVISFNNTTRRFYLDISNNQEITYFNKGLKKELSTCLTLQISDVVGIHFIYIEDEILKEFVSPTDKDLENILKNGTSICKIYWNGISSLLLQDMRFNYKSGSNIQIPYFLKNIDGVFNGCSINITNDDSENTDILISSGYFSYLDIQNTISENLDLQFVYYNNGFKEHTTAKKLPTSLWNNIETGELNETNIDNFSLIHIVVTADSENPIKAIIGQGSYSNLEEAQSKAYTEKNSLTLGSFPEAKYRFLATIITKSVDGGVIYVKTDTDEKYIFYSDSTTIITNSGGGGGGGGGTTEHPLLNNRNSPNQHTTSAITHNGVALNSIVSDYIGIEIEEELSIQKDDGGYFAELTFDYIGILPRFIILVLDDFGYNIPIIANSGNKIYLDISTDQLIGAKILITYKRKVF